MKQEPIERLEHAGLTIRIMPDEDPSDPRGDDNMGAMVCFHRCYKLGDDHKFQSPDDFLVWAKERDVIMLPLYLYDHGGITMSTGSFRDYDPGGWDSGQVGWIYVSKDKLSEVDGRDDADLREQVEERLRSEVKIYDLFLTGGFVGYVVEDKGEHVDSCWGFDDKGYAIVEAKQAAESYLAEIRKCEQACAL